MVCGTAGLPYPTAELTWGSILALFRRIPAEDRATREGRWQISCGLGLNGKTLGVVGLGGLGSRVAKIGRAFEMDVIAWSQNLTAARAAEIGATLVTKDELLARSDVVSIHLVLGDRTRRLVGARELAADEADRLSDQHVARPDRRRGRARRPRSARARSPARGSTCTTRSRSRSIIPCAIFPTP